MISTANAPIKQAYGVTHQPKWQRTILLTVLGYEALGCLAGGALLLIAPDGRLMKMPTDIMHGAFPDFLIPGMILSFMGILTALAFFSVLGHGSYDWLLSALSMGGLAIWFWVEIAILQRLHWLHAMWGLPVVAGGLATLSLFRPHVLLRASLICGIIAPLLYVACNIVVPLSWPAYNSITQTVSELSAVAAPTRFLWNVLVTPYTILSIVFAIGVYRMAAGNRLLRIAALLLIIYGCLGLLWPFSPMHLRETLAAGGGTFSDIAHISLGIITELIYLVALGLAAAAMGRAFRLYSIITFSLLLVFAILTFREAPNIAKNLPTPYIGLWERINIGLFLLWVVVLAVTMLRRLSIMAGMQMEHERPISVQSQPAH